MSDLRPVVIDASVAIAVLLGEPVAPSVARAIAGWASSGKRRVVPAHFWLEVTNTLSRVPDMSGDDILAAIHRLDTFGLETVELGRPLILRAIDAIERHRLTAYDATYLALAESIDADLATLDAELAAAAGPRSIGFDGSRRIHEPATPYEHDVTWPNYKDASAYLAKLRAEALAGR